MIHKLVDWGKKEQSIRALILSGSRTQNREHDALADYDLSVFTDDSFKYEESDEWLPEIGKIWVCVHETLPWKNETIPTRLVIFEKGIKVDFAFYPLAALDTLSNEPLPNDYANGYQILLDKDNQLGTMPKPTFNGFKQKPPTKNEYDRVVQEFWFEVCHVAKYLARGDLWSAKFRDHGLKQEFLLPMIRWREQARHHWDYVTHSQGKRMHQWASAEVVEPLNACFSGSDLGGCWKGLFATIALFKWLSEEVAKDINTDYPFGEGGNIEKFVNNCFLMGKVDK